MRKEKKSFPSHTSYCPKFQTDQCTAMILRIGKGILEIGMLNHMNLPLICCLFTGIFGG